MKENNGTVEFKPRQFKWAVNFLENHGTDILRRPLFKKMVYAYAENWFAKNKKAQLNGGGEQIPGVVRDRYLMSLAILESLKRALDVYDLSEPTMDSLMNIVVKELFINQELRRQKAKAFRQEHGYFTPSFIVISPSKACNLRCVGCYADSTERVQTLDWDLVDSIVRDARELWGTQFVVISGGEPLAYRSQGKSILDIVENNPESFFMMYTNGTLIDDGVASRMASMGNILPAISLEGWQESTDRRRGEGVFDRVMRVMDRLFAAGVLYGVSLTATRHNAEEILSDAFIDFLFAEKHAIITWIFQYMPIGRSFTLELMPTPEQRLQMWRKSWELIREKRVFLADFWNHGTLVDGCLSAGGHNNGGYFYIEWNGNVTPCVFVPYSPVNVNDIYSNGGNLNNIYDHPFFADIRNWQMACGRKNLLMPCLIRDHNKDLRRLISIHEPNAIDENAELTLIDPLYADGMDKYAREYNRISHPVWERDYLKV